MIKLKFHIYYLFITLKKQLINEIPSCRNFGYKSGKKKTKNYYFPIIPDSQMKSSKKEISKHRFSIFNTNFEENKNDCI